MTRLLVALAIAAGLAFPAFADACSCVGGDPRERMAGADAAIVGVIESRREERVRPWDGVGEMDGYVYVIRVERTFKGSPADLIEFATPRFEASCGLERNVGERIGLLLRGEGPRYGGGVCDTIREDELEQAGEPFPTPQGSGRLEALVAGSFGDAGMAGYDRRGRLLGYAFGSEGSAVSACPGGRYALQAGATLSRIRLRDLRVTLSRGPFPGDDVHAIRCLDREGRRAIAVAYDHGANTKPRVVGHRNGRSSIIDSLSGLDAAVSSVSISPDGRRAAMVEDRKAHLIDLRTLRRTHAAIPRGFERTTWLADGRFAIFPARGRGRLLDLAMKTVASLPRLDSYWVAAAGDELYAIDFRNRLLRAGRDASRATVLARLPEAQVRGIEIVPGGVRVSAPRQAARPAARQAKFACHAARP